MVHCEAILTSGVPSVLVVFSWIHTNRHLNRLEHAMEGTNRRIDELQRSLHEMRESFQRDMQDLLRELRAHIDAYGATKAGRVAAVADLPKTSSSLYIKAHGESL